VGQADARPRPRARTPRGGYDVRGHGMSGKPEGDALHKPGEPWADEAKAVVDALELRRPVLVGWSYGGRISGDCLNEQGSSALGAMSCVDAASSAATLRALAAAGGTTSRTLPAATTRRRPAAAPSPSCAIASRPSTPRRTSRPCSPST
jgi:pimeloyl-ACP methyl ester carboxylesterase